MQSSTRTSEAATHTRVARLDAGLLTCACACCLAPVVIVQMKRLALKARRVVNTRSLTLIVLEKRTAQDKTEGAPCMEVPGSAEVALAGSEAEAVDPAAASAAPIGQQPVAEPSPATVAGAAGWLQPAPLRPSYCRRFPLLILQLYFCFDFTILSFLNLMLSFSF